jgi:hypothetical protein
MMTAEADYTAEELKFMERITVPRPPVPPLNTSPPARHPLAGRSKGVRSTSRQTLKAVRDQLGPKQMEMYLLLQGAKRPVCDLELVKALGWPVSSVNARRNELMEMGKVEEAGRWINPATGKRSIYWKAVTSEAQS